MALLAAHATATEPNPVRLAVIPFSAPQKNDLLRKAAGELPDLLMVRLSQKNQFQLVERDKVNLIWSELHLAEDGFVSAKSAEQLGSILSCDWLVGGSIVQVGTNIQLWIKVIDVHSGIVLDLKTFPYNPTNFSATISPIPSFLARVDPQSPPRQFIALGRFADQSLSSSRADWSQRLPALIERHFLEAGFGVVEREAVAPIFSEFQFESAGLTGDYTNRVKLKPAFWIVDGGYKWIYDTQEKLSVALRVQKIGGAVQIFRFSVPPGELEKTVDASIQSAMTNPPLMNSEQAALAESTAADSTGMKFAAGHDEFGNGNIPAIREDTINKFKQALLLNPNDQHARYMLGLALFETVDPETVRQGKELLEEAAASNDPQYATMAKNLLDDFAKGRLTVRALPLGGFEVTPHGQPLSWPKIPTLSPTNPQVIAINQQIAAINEITNIAARVEPLEQIPPPASSGSFGEITTVNECRGQLFIACKPNPSPFARGHIQLYKYDPATESTVEIKLPAALQHPINSVVADENSLWLGTDGDGLLQISKFGGLIRQFGENKGFPSASVTSLQMEDGRVLVSFGGQDSGFIDPVTGKFTGTMSGVNTFKSGNDMLPKFALPPALGTNFHLHGDDGPNAMRGHLQAAWHQLDLHQFIN